MVEAMEGGYCVAFTGHRSYCHESDAVLQETVEQLYASGARTFRVGMAEGFDLAAAECVAQLQRKYGNVSLEAYVPFPEFINRFTAVDSMRYNAIMAVCDRVSYATAAYEQSSFMRRNDMLVDGAQVVVAWWNGSNSGTGYTIRQARRCGARVMNIYPTTQYSIEF